MICRAHLANPPPSPAWHARTARSAAAIAQGSSFKV